MGFRKGAYATVWEIKSTSPTVVRARITTSKKNKETEKYETDFSGFVAFVGSNAAQAASSLKPKDKIRLGDVEVTNSYVKEKETTYTNFTIFSFDYANEGNTSSPTVSNPVEGEQDDSSECPW